MPVKPDVNNIAAAAAIAALDSLFICMMESSIVMERGDIAVHVLKTRPMGRLLRFFILQGNSNSGTPCPAFPGGRRAIDEAESMRAASQ
jgi:hypothetical protein